MTDPLPPRFQEQVWQRIARAESKPGTAFWSDFVQVFLRAFTRPRVAYAYLTVLMAAGVAAGILTAQAERARLETDLGQRYVQTIDPYRLAASNP